MTIRNREEMLGEVDMLRGNINRICVSDNVEEISDFRKKFYKFILRERYDKILKVAFNKVQKFSNL